MSEVVELAAQLVRIPSHPGVERREEAVARALAGWLEARGVAARLDEVAPGRPNLIATVRGARPGWHLLLCGHTDTVPLNHDGSGYGFAGELVGGELRGRGAVDMKGALAAMAAAMVELGRDGLDAGAVTFAAVVDEEMESLGAERLVRTDLPALAVDGAIVGEPTGNRLCRGHKGLEWLEVELVGRAAHGGTPKAGVNAIAAAGRFLALIETKLAPRLATRSHPLLGAPTINVGTIHGGDQPSTVAARCVVTLDRRTVPGESFASLTAELEALLAEVRQGLPGLSTTLRRLAGGMATMEHGPLFLDAGHSLVAACDAARRAAGLGAAPHGAFPAWTDGALLAEPGGVPTVVLGPGDLAVAHSPREAVPVAELEQAARIYAAAARAFGGG
jgi:acetylornithine deacetylase/succinyl-diaminopimelate desuccinylase